jgi:hypothetical protein
VRLTTSSIAEKKSYSHNSQRASTEKRLSTLVAKLEKQVSIVERDRRLMANQIRALADEVSVFDEVGFMTVSDDYRRKRSRMKSDVVLSSCYSLWFS